MPYFVRERKDIIDLRPIRLDTKPRLHSFLWKLKALLMLDDKGNYIFPFSRRLVPIDGRLYPRGLEKPMPYGYQECACVGCEHKTYADHLLKGDDDVDPENGTLHLEEVYVASDDDEDKKSVESSIVTDDQDQQDWTEQSTSRSSSPFACDPYESYDWEC